MEPRRGVVAPELDRWCRDAGQEDRRTAIVRLRGGTDPEWAASQLATIGMAVVSSGPGSVVGHVSPPQLRHIGQEPWVLAVEQPRGLRPLPGG